MPKPASETFTFEGLWLTVPSSVYPPKEDTELLATLVKTHARGRFLDFGCASGTLGLLALQNPRVTSVTFADINPSAIKTAKANYQANLPRLPPSAGNKPVFFILTNFFSNLGTLQFDCISFNPPYLPTAQGEKVKGVFNKALDGGSDGRKVTDSFLKQFASHLTPNGRLLILDSSLAGYAKTLKALKAQGFRASIEARRRFFFEEIVAICATRTRSQHRS